MKRLFQLEFNKIFYYKTARVFLLIYISILGLLAVTLPQDISVFGLEINLSEFGVFDFPNVWHFITFFAAFFKIFLAIIIIATVANEFTYGTVKQNLIDGLTKKELIASKMLTNITFSFASTLIVFVTALVLGLIFTENEYNPLEEIHFLGAYFLKLVTFFSFITFLCVWLKNTAFAIILYIIWFFVELILNLVEVVLRVKVFDQKVVEDGSLLTEYLPLSSMWSLIPSPLKRVEMIDNLTQGQLNEIAVQPSYVVVCVGYFVLFNGLSYLLLRKRDL